MDRSHSRSLESAQKRAWEVGNCCFPSKYREGREASEKNLKKTVTRLKKLRDEAKTMLEEKFQASLPEFVGEQEPLITSQRNQLEELKKNTDEIINFYKKATFRGKPFNKFYPEEYERLEKSAIKAQEELEGSFEKIKQKTEGITYSQFTRLMDECKSAIDKFEIFHKERKIMKYFIETEKNISGRYEDTKALILYSHHQDMDQPQDKLKELEERKNRVLEELKTGTLDISQVNAERDFQQYIDDLQKADRGRESRLFDLDKRAQNLHLRLDRLVCVEQENKHKYIKNLEKLKEQALDPSQGDPLKAEGDYRRYVNELQKEVEQAEYRDRANRISGRDEHVKMLSRELKILMTLKLSNGELDKNDKDSAIREHNAIIKNIEDIKMSAYKIGMCEGTYYKEINRLHNRVSEEIEKISNDTYKHDEYKYKKRIYKNWEKAVDRESKLNEEVLDNYIWTTPHQRGQELKEFIENRYKEHNIIRKEFEYFKGIHAQGLQIYIKTHLNTYIRFFENIRDNYRGYPGYWGLKNNKKYEKTFSSLFSGLDNLYEGFCRNVENYRKSLETSNQSVIAENEQKLKTLVNDFQKWHKEYQGILNQLNKELKASPLLPKRLK
jgi:hypothetical protein